MASVGRALGIPVDVADPATPIGHALAGRGDFVLVLDSFDRFAARGELVAAWAAQAPRARLLLTSRASVPAGARTLEVGPLGEADAVALLVARARARGVEAAGDQDLTGLARRLDGVPLALELAAGRLGVLTVREVLERVDLSLLRRGTDDRHGTLPAALDWSWTQLDEVERGTLARLSVFVGGFTLPAAEAVVEGGDVPVVDVLGTLVDRSLVSVGSPGRFHLLASTRAHAARKLEEAGQTEVSEARHGAWFASLRDPSADLDNVVAACRPTRSGSIIMSRQPLLGETSPPRAAA